MARPKSILRVLHAVRVLTIIHQDDAGPGVFAEVPGAELVPWRADRDPAPALDGVDAALVLGAAANVNDTEANPWMAEDIRVVAELLDRGVPTLGVCLGAQLLAKAAGGSVERAAAPEIGWYEVALEPGAEQDPLVGALPERFVSFQWHSYVAVPPDGSISAGPQRALPPGLPAGGRAGLGHPVPRRGVAGRRGRVDAACTTTTRTPWPWAWTRSRSRPRPTAGSRAGTSSGATCSRASWRWAPSRRDAHRGTPA